MSLCVESSIALCRRLRPNEGKDTKFTLVPGDQVMSASDVRPTFGIVIAVDQDQSTVFFATVLWSVPPNPTKVANLSRWQELAGVG